MLIVIKKNTHIHIYIYIYNDDCYNIDLVCKLEENEDHSHDDDCYTKDLVCGKEEHEHTLICYSNKEADLDYDKWEFKAPGLLTTNWHEDFLNTVISQIGYEESSLNYEVDEFDNKLGYSIYGDIVNNDPYGKWNMAFINWCLSYAQIPSALPENFEDLSIEEQFAALWYVPQNNDLLSWVDNLYEQGYYYDLYPEEEYEPVLADVVFFDENQDGVIEDYGIVAGINYEIDENGELTDIIESIDVVRADYENKVAVCNYLLNDFNICGFATLPDNPNEYFNSNVPDPFEEDPFNNEIENSFDTVAYLVTLPKNPFAFMPFSLEEPGESLPLTNSNVKPNGVTMKWHENHDGAEINDWKNLPTDGSTIPADAHLRFEVQYENVNPAQLQQNGYTLSFTPDKKIQNIKTSGSIEVGGVKRGVIETVNDVVYLKFDPAWIDQVIADAVQASENEITIAGKFYFQGALNLTIVEDDADKELNLGGVRIPLPVGNDLRAEYGDLNIQKTRLQENGKDLIEVGGKHYLKYEILVDCKSDEMPNVVLRDIFSNRNYINGYYGVPGETNVLASHSEGTLSAPFETVQNNEQAQASKVYLTSDATNTSISKGQNLTFTKDSNGEIMVWEIGDMKKGEKRALTYYVEVDPSYIGIPHNNNEAITNTVSAYSKGYPHNNAQTSYRPTANASVQKNLVGNKPVDLENGSYRYDYEVIVTAPLTNEYNLTNLSLRDSYSDRGVSNLYLDEISYNTDSVQIYTRQNGETNWNSVADINTNINESSHQLTTINNFELVPGQQYKFVYSMTIDATDATIKANGQVGIYNRAYLNSNKNSSTREIAHADQGYNLWSKKWEEKSSPGQIRNELTLNVTGDVYDGRNKVVDDLLPSYNATNFVVPSGAYKYVVNINGGNPGWDISGSNWKDTISNNDGTANLYLKLIGYMQVEIFDAVTNQVKETKWVYVNGNTGFDFNASQIGIGTESTSEYYRLTYYGQAQSISGNSYGVAIVNNEFEFGGSVVGPGNTQYTNLSFRNSIRSRIEDPAVEAPSKHAWYYDPNDTSFAENNSGYRNTGAIYWYIQQGGSKIPELMRFQESIRVTVDNKMQENNFFRKENSFLGFYSINLRELAVDKGIIQDSDSNTKVLLEDIYPTYEKFMEGFGKGEFVEVPSSYYSHSTSGGWSDYHGGTYYDYDFIFNKEYSLAADENLFLIIRTEPSELPAEKSTKRYDNKVNYKADKEGNLSNWNNSADYITLYGPHGSLDKEVDGLFKISNSSSGNTKYEVWDHNTNSYVEILNYNNSSILQQSSNVSIVGNNNSLTPFAYTDGIYAVWNITLNQLGEINNEVDKNGDYTVIDYLPDGVELEYVRASFVHATNYGKYENDTSLSARVIASSKEEFVEDGWSEHTIKSPLVENGNNQALTYYYTNKVDGEKQIKLFVPKLFGGLSGTNNKVVFQVVCKVTDPNIYMEDVSFINSATLLNKNNQEIESDSALIKAFNGNLNKTDLTTLFNQGNQVALTIPYTIAINDLAEDMDPNSDEISVPLIDHMSKNLSVNMDSIKIYMNYIDEMNEGTLIYDSRVPQSDITLNGSPLYQATDRYGNKLYWQESPYIKEEGKVALLSTTITPNDFPVFSTLNVTKQADKVTANKLILGGQNEDDPNKLTLYDLNLDVGNKWTTFIDKGFVRLNSDETAYSEIHGGEYKLAFARFSDANKFFTKNTNGNFLKADANETDAEIFTFEEIRDGIFIIQSSDGKFLNIDNGRGSLTDNAQYFKIKKSNAIAKTYSIHVVAINSGAVTDTNKYINAFAGNKNQLGGWDSANAINDIGSSLLLYQHQIIGSETATDVTEPTKLYWEQTYGFATMGITQTDYPVLTTNPAAMDGIKYEKCTADAGGAVIGNIHLKNDSGEFLYYVLNDDGSIKKDDNGNSITTTTVTSKPYKTNIKITVEDYVDEYGNKDGSTAIKFYNLPDSVSIGIKYNVTSQVSTGTDISYSNEAYWEGHDKSTSGSTERDEMEFLAGSSAEIITHAAAKITKFDGNDTSKTLEGAKFALFRAKYQNHTPNHLYRYNGTSLIVDGDQEHTLPAIYRVDENHHIIEEMVVVRNATDDTLYGFLVGNDPDPTKNTIMSYSDLIAEHPDWILEHKLEYDTKGRLVIDCDYDANGNIVTVTGKDSNNNDILNSKVLAYGETDQNGIKTYGFRDDETKIHFNKVYAIVEIEAPEGYGLDENPHFFVVPNESQSGNGDNYFYHKNEQDFPDDVHIVRKSQNGVLTYYLSVYDYKASVQVAKDFNGNNLKDKYKAGTYTFGIWKKDDVNLVTLQPTGTDKMIDSKSLKYNESDFNWYVTFTNSTSWNEFKEENGKWYMRIHSYNQYDQENVTEWSFVNNKSTDAVYGILPNRQKVVTFTNLDYGQDYYVYELDADGNPIVNNGSAQTENGNIFEIKYSSTNTETYITADGHERLIVEGNRITPISGRNTQLVPIVIATNISYEINLNKSFISNNGLAIEGITGTYKFGIWQYDDQDQVNLTGPPLDTKTITWSSTEKATVKSVKFDNLLPGKYVIFEIDDDGNPMIEDDYSSVSGKFFKVNYNGNIQTITKDNYTELNSNVTNKVYYVELPETGGVGNKLVIASISLITMPSILLIKDKKSKDKKRE